MFTRWYLSGQYSPTPVKIRISGTVTSGNTDDKFVLLYDRVTGSLLGTCLVDKTTGTWEIYSEYKADQTLTVICRDEGTDYNADIYDRVSLCTKDFTFTAELETLILPQFALLRQVLLNPATNSVVYTIPSVVTPQNLLGSIAKIDFSSGGHTGVFETSADVTVPVGYESANYDLASSLFINENFSGNVVNGTPSFRFPYKSNILNILGDGSCICCFDISEFDPLDWVDLSGTYHITECTAVKQVSAPLMGNIFQGVSTGSLSALVQTDITLTGRTNFSISGVLQVKNTSSPPIFVQKYVMVLYVGTSTSLVVQVGNGTTGWGSTATASNAVNIGKWNHFTVTVAGTTIKIYTSGVLRTTATLTVPSSYSGLLGLFGDQPVASINTSALYDFRLFNKTLSDAEVTTLYNASNIDEVAITSINSSYVDDNAVVLHGTYLDFDYSSLGNSIAMSDFCPTMQGVGFCSQGALFTSVGALHKLTLPTDTGAGGDVGNESIIDITARFFPTNVSKGTTQVLYKSGGASNGIALGLTTTGQLSLYGRSGGILTQITAPAGLLADRKWYGVKCTNTALTVYDADWEVLSTVAGTCTAGNGTEQQSIGGVCANSPATGTSGNQIELYEGLISDVSVFNTTTAALSFPLDRLACEVQGSGERCTVEVASWNPLTRTGSIWVHVPKAPSGTNSFLKFYFNPDGPTDTTYIGTVADKTNPATVETVTLAGSKHYPLVGWETAKRLTLILDSSKIDADMSNFPVRLNLSTSAGDGYDCSDIFTTLGANSKKLAIEWGSTGTQCFVEIERWDNANNVAQLWVRVPEVYANKPNFLTLYYDNTHSDNSSMTVAEAQDDLEVGVYSRPNSGLWDISGNESSIYTAQGRLVVSGNTTKFARFQHGLTGNFSFTAYGASVVKPATNEWFSGVGCTWKNASGGYDFVLAGCGYTAGYSAGYAYFIKVISGVRTVAQYVNYDSLQQYRLVRTGSTITAYLRAASTWVQFTPVDTAYSGQVFPILGNYVAGSFPSIVGEFSGFKVESADGITGFVGDSGSVPASMVWDKYFVLVSHQAQSPTTSVIDSTSYGVNGTSVGNMTAGDLVDGAVGKALEYDGVDDYTYHPYNAAHNITTTLTLEAIIKPSELLDTNSTTNSAIISRQNITTNGHDTYALLIDTDGRLQLNSNTGKITSTKESWSSGSTFHVASTYNSTGLDGDLFVNSVKETLVSDTLDAMSGSTSNQVTIGCNLPSANDYFPGMIDEVRISNTVRSDAWLKASYYSNVDDLIYYREDGHSDALRGWGQHQGVLVEVDSSAVPPQAYFPVQVGLSTASGTNSEDVSIIFDAYRKLGKFIGTEVVKYNFAGENPNFSGMKVKNLVVDNFQLSSNGCTYFNNTADSVIKFPMETGYRFKESWTLSFWVNISPNASSVYCYPFGSTVNADLFSIAIYVTAGEWYISQFNSSGASVSHLSLNKFAVGTFVHVCITYNGTTLLAYYNGINIPLNGTIPFPATSRNGNFVLGQHYSYYMYGWIADFMLSKEVLSADEVMQLYRIGGAKVKTYLDNYSVTLFDASDTTFQLKKGSAINSIAISYTMNSQKIAVAFTPDNLTYYVYLSSTWRAVASKDPAIHGNVGDTDWYSRDSGSVWAKRSTVKNANNALADAFVFTENYMPVSSVAALTSTQYNSIYNSATGIFDLAIGLCSNQENKIPKVTKIIYNNTEFWSSDVYDLEPYDTKITSSRVNWIWNKELGTKWFKVYVIKTGDTSWTECPTNGGAIPGITAAMDTTGMSMQFKVEFDLSIQSSPTDIGLEFEIF